MKLRAAVSRLFRSSCIGPGETERDFERAATDHPDDPESLGRYARAISSAPGERDRARHLFERALELDPAHVENLWGFARLASRYGNRELAHNLLERATACAPTYPRLLFAFARFSESELQDYAAAESLYGRAIAASLPDDAEILDAYAEFLWKVRGDMAGAQRHYERAMAAEPRNARIVGNLALLKERQGELDDARRLHERACELAPARAHVLCNFAVFLEKVAEDARRAAEMYDRAAFSTPTGYELPFLIGYFRRTGQHEATERLFERWMQLTPDNPATLIGFAAFLQEVRNDVGRAEQLLYRASIACQGSSGAITTYASVLQQRGEDPARLRVLYERVLEQDPGDEIALGNLGQVLLLSGDSKRGLELVQEAISVSKLPALDVELYFYLFAHVEETNRKGALADLKRLVIVQGVRSPGWNLKANAEKAIADGHPAGEWLLKLAAVITEGAPVSDLDGWAEWAAIEV